jgi:hypothetical protein
MRTFLKILFKAKVMQRPSLCRNICFSVLMFLLLILTVSSIGVVLINTFRVIFGYSPTKSVDSEVFILFFNF